MKHDPRIGCCLKIHTRKLKHAFGLNLSMRSRHTVILVTEGEEQCREMEQVSEVIQRIEGEARRKKGKCFGGETIGFLDLVLG